MTKQAAARQVSSRRKGSGLEAYLTAEDEKLLRALEPDVAKRLAPLLHQQARSNLRYRLNTIPLDQARLVALSS